MAKSKHAGGRPTLFDSQKAGQILLALRAGNYVETAAAFAGVTKQTVYNWLKRGARRTKAGLPFRGEEAYAEFFDAVEKAKATAEVNAVALIQTAAKKNWQAAAWYLERTNRKWARVEKHELTGADGDPLPQPQAGDTVVIYVPDNGRGDSTPV